jgi:acetylserotonin O-methyltransferase, plant
MTLRLLAEVGPQDMLVALAELHSHMIGYVKSMALKCAVDLGIPNAIHRCGGAATLADIATHTAVHPAKVRGLQRVMELLCTSGIFFSSTAGEDNNGAAMYGLTTTGRFLVGERNLSPMVPFLMSPLVVSSFFSMCDWLRCEPAVAGSPFELAHGCPQWEMASKDATLNRILNDSMVADSQLSLEVIILDKGYIFHGLSSLVDVGGGHGAAAQVIANAFPRINCTVLDLPHVIGQGTTRDYGKLRFVAGDMFESIPPADAVLLKVCIDIAHHLYNYLTVANCIPIIPFHPHNYDILIKMAWNVP